MSDDPRAPRTVPPDVRTRLPEFQRGGRRYAGARAGELPPPAPAPALLDAPTSITLLPPTVIRPPRARDFHLDGSATGLTTALTTPPLVVPGTAFVVPSNNVAVIRTIELNVNTLLATSNILWSLRFDGSPVEGWNNLTVFPRAAGSVSRSFGPEETQIPVPDGAAIDIVIQILDGATYQAGASFGGWFYDRRLDEVFSRAWRT